MIKQCDSIIIPTDYVVCEVANPTLMERIEKERKGKQRRWLCTFCFGFRKEDGDSGFYMVVWYWSKRRKKHF